MTAFMIKIRPIRIIQNQIAFLLIIDIKGCQLLLELFQNNQFEIANYTNLYI